MSSNGTRVKHLDARNCPADKPTLKTGTYDFNFGKFRHL